ncbi:MAG: hypothetical protein NVS2B17_31040 [Candidatus Velthaea sp.]
MTTTTDEYAMVFVDLETTGLDHERDAITEMAWVYDHDEEDGITVTVEEHRYARYDGFPSLWSAAHTDALDPAPLSPSRGRRCARQPIEEILTAFFSQMLTLSRAGTRPIYLAGACPAFDDRFLRKHFREVPYHYHVIDVEAQAMGVLGLPVPQSLGKLRAALGIAGENEHPHNALADALEARVIYEACLA